MPSHSLSAAARSYCENFVDSPAADFIAKKPELLDSRIMLTHYSAGALFSADARASFVEPDLDPIPQPIDPAP